MTIKIKVGIKLLEKIPNNKPIIIESGGKFNTSFEVEDVYGENTDIDILCVPSENNLLIYGVKNNKNEDENIELLELNKNIFLHNNCERCGHSFKNNDLEMYNKELLCSECIDEVKDEIGSPHNYLN